ncbi:hypothetical protein [Streptomyces sp. E5N91]|uniref:hypothetical protein n=1 Tax=Streptomyces sp. E5N91 TaxID=1851996 RepID=UPI000EF6055D|nr:hypothetical protein [Streptomyces sp. E5N91]
MARGIGDGEEFGSSPASWVTIFRQQVGLARDAVCLGHSGERRSDMERVAGGGPESWPGTSAGLWVLVDRERDPGIRGVLGA